MTFKKTHARLGFRKEVGLFALALDILIQLKRTSAILLRLEKIYDIIGMNTTSVTSSASPKTYFKRRNKYALRCC